MDIKDALKSIINPHEGDRLALLPLSGANGWIKTAYCLNIPAHS